MSDSGKRSIGLCGDLWGPTTGWVLGLAVYRRPMDDFMGAMITERERLRRLSDQLERLVELTDQVNPETTPLEVILAFTKRQIIRLDDLIEIYDAGPPRNRSLN